jgi:hypothetical protein
MMFNYKYQAMFRNGELHCQREYVGKKLVHDVRTLQPFREVLSAQESVDKDRRKHRLTPHWTIEYGEKLNTEIS